nr:MAG TPA: hypothetical protein [Caudoviricetes sp.]
MQVRVVSDVLQRGLPPLIHRVNRHDDKSCSPDFLSEEQARSIGRSPAI